MPDHVTTIRPHFGDEHVIAVDPPIRTSTDDFWRRRIRPFAGRSLSHKALESEQQTNAGMQRLRGQSVSHGTVSGLEIHISQAALGQKPDTARIEISEGLGLARSGEDVTILSPRSLIIGSLPVIAPVALEEAAGEEEISVAPSEISHGGLQLRPEAPRQLYPQLGKLISQGTAEALPRIAILIAEPIVTTTLANPGDPDCPPDPRDDAYDDLQYIDGARLALYFWPEEMVGTGGNLGYALPTAGTDRRNIIAHRIFAVEEHFESHDAHPWEKRGVPLALVGFTDDWKLDFVDSAAVSRAGGQPKARSSLVDWSGNSQLWQARVSQFAEQLLTLENVEPGKLAQHFEFLPPVGILPVDVVDPFTRRQSFFPAGFSTTLAPVPLEQLDLVIRESAGLDPFSMSVPDQVEMLLAVPARIYDPELLKIAVVDPAFQQAINRFSDDRSDWLIRREIVRRRYDALLLCNGGQYAQWRASDSPPNELVLAKEQSAPFHSQAIIIQSGSGVLETRIAGAHIAMNLSKTQKFFIWVRISESNPATAIAMRLNDGASGEEGGFNHGYAWGDRSQLPFFKNGDFDQSAFEPLPKPGGWIKLEVDADAVMDASGTSFAGKKFDGVTISQSGGEVAWGPVGVIDADGQEQIFYAGQAPDGATLSLSAESKLAPSASPEEESYGTIISEHAILVADKTTFRSRWQQNYFQRHFDTLDESGFGGLIAELDKRLNSTNDAIDLGFVRARSDIYRLREYILGNDAASNMVTSPALSDLATRDQSARATGLDLAKFLEKSHTTLAKDTLVTPATMVSVTLASTASSQPPVAAPNYYYKAASSKSVENTMVELAPIFAGSGVTSVPLFIGENTASGSTKGVGSTRSPSPLGGSIFPEKGTTVAGGIIDTDPVVLSAKVIPQYRVAADYQSNLIPTVASVKAGIFSKDFTYQDIVLDRPIPGFVERTVSVAERFKEPPSKKAYEYALAGKLAVMNTISGLIGDRENQDRARGIALADLPAPGFKFTGDAAAAKAAGRTINTIGDILFDENASGGDPEKSEYSDETDLSPEPDDRHEAEYFNAAVKAIDNAIALMRLIEGRVDIYSKFLADARRTETAISEQIANANARLQAIGIELEEARHDVDIAQALLAEEEQNVLQTNSRRAGIIRDFGNQVIFRRPRFNLCVDNVASIQTLDALIKDPVVTCLTNHDDQPEEIREYVALFHDSPVSWFPAIANQVNQIDRRALAQKTLLAVQMRTQFRQIFTFGQVAGRTKSLTAVQNALVAHQTRIGRRRDLVNRFNFATLPHLNLGDMQREVQNLASMGDLIDAVRSRSGLAKAAGNLLDNISNVAACLNDRFNAVTPAIRMLWAELLSEYDDPIPLQQLSALPQWASIPIAERRELQNFVDWLFAQINPTEKDAQDAMSELVRICLLMAAHSPVDQLIPATLVAPTPAELGRLIPLRIDVSIIRTGLTGLIRDQNGKSIATARIEEIGADIAQARITRLYSDNHVLDQGMRVDFGAMVRMK